MKTKDYIYLDDDLLNSLLAQFEKGLLIKESQEQGFDDTDSLGSASNTTTGVDGIFGFGAKIQQELKLEDISSSTEFARSIAENVLHDFAVDVLIENCSSHHLLDKDVSESAEGDFLLFSSNFQIYDFEYIKNITDNSALAFLKNKKPQGKSPQASSAERTKQLLKEQADNSAMNNFQTVHNISTFAGTLFADSVLIKSDAELSVCKKNKLRLSQAQLNLQNESSRKIKVFGIVSAIKKETHPNGDYKILNSNQLEKVPLMLFDIFMSNFNILTENARIIKPIAIYFEAD